MDIAMVGIDVGKTLCSLACPDAEDRVARTSILAENFAPRPDRSKQGGHGSISEPPCGRSGRYVHEMPVA
jgi:hypothetical protein